MKTLRVLTVLAMALLATGAAYADSNTFGNTNQYLGLEMKGEVYFLDIPSGYTYSNFYKASAHEDVKLKDFFDKEKPVTELYSTALTVGTANSTYTSVSALSYTTGFPGVTKELKRDEWFAVKYTGKFGLKTATKLTFKLYADDGAILKIDGKEEINLDGVHAISSKSSRELNLAAGDHTIEVQYFQGPRVEVCLYLLCNEKPFDVIDYPPSDYRPRKPLP